MGKRLFDILCSLTGLILVSPFFLILVLLIVLDSRGGPFFKQTRVGKAGKPFRIIKFRTMHQDAEKEGLLTVDADMRITRLGKLLRATKLDELPQLWNVLLGQMSMVGPRPEVPEYVSYYTKEQRLVLEVRPGITDHASIEYRHESKLLGTATDPQQVYLQEIMPKKLKLNQDYIRDRSLSGDLLILLKTILKLFR